MHYRKEIFPMIIQIEHFFTPMEALPHAQARRF